MSAPTFAGLQAIAMNAQTRKLLGEFDGAIEFLYLRLSWAYSRAVLGSGRELAGDSPVVRYGDEGALNHPAEVKPPEELLSELIESVEVIFTSLMDADGLLRELLRHQDALHSLESRRAEGKKGRHVADRHA